MSQRLLRKNASDPGRSEAFANHTIPRAVESTHAERVEQRAEQFRRWPLSVLLSCASSIITRDAGRGVPLTGEPLEDRDAMVIVLQEYSKTAAARPSEGALEDLKLAALSRGDAHRVETLTGLRASNRAFEMAASRAEARADRAERELAAMRTARRPVATITLYDDETAAPWGTAVVLNDGSVVRLVTSPGASSNWSYDFEPIPDTPAGIEAAAETLERTLAKQDADGDAVLE